jgi:uncharacterized protein (DUF58 family)
MSLASSVSGLALRAPRLVATLATIMRRARGKISRFARNDNHVAGYNPAIRGSQPSMLDAGPETFFDTDFLRRLERLHLIAKRLNWAGAKGEHAVSRKGFSLEFSDYRRYQRGDDLRYVDWNIYRRLDRLLLKIFTAEEEMNIYLLVDTSRSMAEGDPIKLDYARKVAAALGYIGLKNLDRVGGAAFSSVLHKPLTLGRGRKQILSMFSFLAKLSCTGETNLRGTIHSFTKLFPHAGFVVIVSDLFDPTGWRAALEELSGKNYQVLLVHIVDETELKPKPWGDVALVDVEAGSECKFFLDADLVRRFEQELEKYFKEIEELCASRKIDYLRTTTQVPFDEFVLQTLRRVSGVV